MRRATRRRWTTEDKKSYPFLVNPFCFRLHPKQSYYLPWRGWLRYRAESKLPSLRHRLSHRAVSLLLSDTNKVFLSEKKKKRDFSRSTTDKHRCGLALNVSPTCMYGFSLLKMFSHSNICISLRIRQQNELIWNWRNTLISSDFVLFKNVKTVTENIIEIAIKQQAFSCALSALGCSGNVVSAKAKKNRVVQDEAVDQWHVLTFKIKSS